MAERYRLGAYNVRKGRNPERVLREIVRLMRRQRLDALNVSEFNTQLDHVRANLPDHLELVCYPNGDIAARDSAIVIDTRRAARKGRRAFQRRLHGMGGKGWERAPHNRGAGLHNPRKAVSVRLGVLRIGADHWPPGPHGRGYPLRAAAHGKMQRRITRISRRWSDQARPNAGAWVWFGDKNMRPDDPRAVRLQQETEGTAHGTGIDWLLAGPDVMVLRVRKVRAKWLRSDHPAVVAVVEV